MGFFKRKYGEGIWFTHIIFQQSPNVFFWLLHLEFCIIVSARTYVALKHDTWKKVKIFIAQPNTLPHWNKTEIKHCDNFLSIFSKIQYVSVKYLDSLKSTVSEVWKEKKNPTIFIMHFVKSIVARDFSRKAVGAWCDHEALPPWPGETNCF